MFAIELQQFLRRQTEIEQVVVINEESESIVKRTGYADSFAEKITRYVLNTDDCFSISHSCTKGHAQERRK